LEKKSNFLRSYFTKLLERYFFLFLQKYLNREFILEIPRVALKYKESNI